MDRRKQFTFYASYYDAVKKLNKKDQLSLLMAICAYAIDGEDINPDLVSKNVLCAFRVCKPIIDTDRRQSAEGRRCAEYKEWRRNVFERDNYTCQVCGMRGVKINAHHIKEYAFFPELRYKAENGVTLCVPCHKEIHRRIRHGN